MKVLIAGGGIIGLSCAYYLLRSGHDVVITDNTDMTDGASYGNAGHIVPSHFVPLASPGIVAQGLKWMLNASSPFYIKPRPNLELFRWGYHFWRSCNEKTLLTNIPHLQHLLAFSRDLMGEMKNELGNHFYMTEKGILIVYKTIESEKHEQALAGQAAAMGMRSEILSSKQVQELESATTLDVRGGILYQADAHLHPGLFTTTLKNYLLQKGATIIPDTEITGFEKSGNRISAALTKTEKLVADHFILANGAWLPALSKKLGINILLQAGKGYSITYKNFAPQLTYPAILVDHRVVTTPIGNDLRLAGTMEINRPGSPVMLKRVAAIVTSVKKYYPDLNLPFSEDQPIWSGLRPVSPDGLPYIGRHSTCENLLIAGGHAMLGLSLATGTGKLIQELTDRLPCSIPLNAFTVERFG